MNTRAKLSNHFALELGKICMAQICLRFAYDPSEGKCVRFEYGGCQGNENNFKTQRECVRACMIKRSSERIVVLPPPRETTSIYIPIVPKLGYPKRCREPIDSGICHGYIPRFAFDERRGECISFIYGGCKGNRNRFQTRKECQQACLP
ncbi:Kunitz/Bovine pancreatic trypsin inhibitor domain protein [Ancylostoma ceylanicum]|uniref:Kunitz/Bovine pancreatic trypsin inhibitor domain protein n=1 Tax=Ancylostoma ceylanicum TaxID=53326 RepID=A0A0D6M9M7_9BILA|nr:Kunitz/Bovine pancreatic trypsin inhibitor domain protein [Ancylostoma ceylanicum]